jgi:chemotaxis protein MotB
MADQPIQPVIIRRYKKYHTSSHGGAWKIAYADFVTAMMAFFLLMWLINVASEETRKGIAEYFSTRVISMKATSAGTGMIEGEVYATQSSKSDQETEIETDTENNSYTDKDNKRNVEPRAKQQSLVSEAVDIANLEKIDSKKNQEKQNQKESSTKPKIVKKTIEQESVTNEEEKEENESEKIAAEKQQQKEALQKIEDNIKTAFNALQKTEEFKHNLIVELTDEGIRIQIVDSSDREMFKSGSSTPAKFTEKIIRTLGKVITKLPNKINITGHTDSRIYNKKGYGNWELSSDRAHSTRRILEDSNVKSDRFVEVNGRADRDPLNKDDTKAPENRRISITVLYAESQK